MRIKLDENLPRRLAAILAGLGHDVDTVVSEGLAGARDESVWSAVRKTGRFLITQDLDFSDIRQFQPGSHAGLLLVRLREPGRQALLERVRGLFASEAVGDWRGCFVTATEHKLRIKRPT